MQANETGEATRTTTGELPQMLTSGEATQTAVPDAPTARGSAVCASSAAAEVTRAEDATSGLEVVPPAPGSAAPVPQTTGKSTDWVVTASDTVVEPSNDLAATANGTMAAQGDGLAVVATTDGAATVDDGLTVGTHEASDSIALAPIASRKRPKKAAEPATRRSVRIRERTERHVHWATAAPDAGQPAAPRTAPRAALDAIGMSPSAGRGTTTTTTTRATLPDVTSDVQDVSAAVEPRTMATETAGAPATTSTAPAAATPAPRASGASVPRPVAARSARREVTAPPTHREKTATMREAPVVSTEAVTKKRPTKGATKANTARETTATAGVAPTTQNVSNNAVVMTDGADDWGKDEEDAPVGDTLQLSDDELMVAQKRSKTRGMQTGTFHGRVGRESSRPRNRQDRQHGKIQTSGSSDPTNAASSADSSSLTIWPANEQAGRLDQRALGSGRETNERRTNEVWLDATTDSVDDYTAVDDGGVMDREHLASESLDGCDE
ncbi:hypothetical protein PF004_g5920 [Phytophthora fragariae]|uniref:Uncharacterized protein n=1 Tax=Phytophthora fragariae TaxID=53985 RepID=A0A6G0PEE1_9STRA|nr:hypothetical protein PF004_g5920 [Phytophthora fragariae]